MASFGNVLLTVQVTVTNFKGANKKRLSDRSNRFMCPARESDWPLAFVTGWNTELLREGSRIFKRNDRETGGAR